MASKKRRSSSAETRERILRAAVEEFSEKGFDGARVDSIAARAEANKFSVYSYFISKDELFKAVLEKTYRAFRSHQADQDVGGDPRGALERFVRSTFEAFQAVPEINPLASSENLHEAVHIKASPEILSHYSPLLKALKDMLALGEKTGDFRKGLDPVELYVFVSALCAHPMTHQHTLSALFQVDLMTPKRVKRREEIIVEMVMRYVLAKPE